MYDHDEETTREEPRLQVVRETPQAEAPVRKMYQRIEKIPLKGHYEGFSVTAWVNFPNTMLNEMQRLAKEARRKARDRRAALEDDFYADDPEEDEDETMANGPIAVIMKEIIKDHDWVDFKGKPYPPADTDAFYDEVPNDLLMVAWTEIQGRTGKLPTKRPGR